ncbi:Cilia- and flagella-associated protein 36 [Caenorhabditis elegans]|nr:Cilia- and flagella-associated protein 36 [Caenorhabditis elegans]CTQ86916.1 Cilia- and flagella-associated protein 36 [Caenorhabditis elegans]|eukprot:NP_001300217.1 Cilia-and flagella-associated protein 36 [Caenorhabditis elegans]
MMMRKNIELQLQALQMIEFMCGLIPSVLQLEDGETLRNMKKLSPEETERYVLISVLRHSKDEYDSMQKGSEELEMMAQNSRIQREALEQEIRKEEILLQQALDEGARAQNQNQNQGTSSTQTDGVNAPLRSVAAMMAATFAIDTATSTDDVTYKFLDQSTGTMTSSTGVSVGTLTNTGVSSGTMTSGVDTGTDADGTVGRPKSAKRVGSAVGKRSVSKGTPSEDAKKSSGSSSPDEAEKSKRERPGTSVKKAIGIVAANSEMSSNGTQMDVPVDEEGTKKRPGTTSKKSIATVTASPEMSSKTTQMEPEQDGEGKKRPETSKGANERKYSNAGLEDIVGPKSSPHEEKKSSHPSSRKGSKATDENAPATRPPSRKAAGGSHEPRAKTPNQKNKDERPTTRRSSVDKNAPKRNDSVPRERKSSVSHDESKPPKPIGPLRGNKYDGDVVLGRAESPGIDHGPRRKNLNDVNSHLVDTNRLNSSDVRVRAQYLREQRDKLLQMKNAERIKQMTDIQQNASLERPKTAARAREILDKDKKEAVAIRKEISDKLKTQILTLHH